MPDVILVEKAHDLGRDQRNEIVWSAAGYAHERCLARAKGYRPKAS